MKQETYYSKAFPAQIHPINDIYGFDPIEFQKALDTLFRMSDWTSGEKNFQKPMNIILGKSSHKIIIGINFDKAIWEFNSLTNIVQILEDEKAESQIRNFAKDEFGFQINAFLKLDFDSFKSIYNNLLKEFNDYNQESNYESGITFFSISPEEQKCINDLRRGIKKSNSLYGGNNMIINPLFKARDISPDPNLCFCVLPFNQNRLEIFDEVIKPTLENEFKITVVRSGNIFTPNLNIMESIWTYINQAAFIIADLSDQNPNVFYELGICHTLGKPVITLCDESSYEDDYKGKLPFDISSINTIFYKNSGAGPTKLVNEIKKNVKALRSGQPYIE